MSSACGSPRKYSKLNSESLPEGHGSALQRPVINRNSTRLLMPSSRYLRCLAQPNAEKKFALFKETLQNPSKRWLRIVNSLFSAPSKASLFSVSSIWTEDREGLEESIRDEQLDIEGMRDRISQLKEQFRNQLHEIGIEVFDDEIDYLLMPVTKDDIISMAAIVTNIASITAQLEMLTEDSKELQSHTKRYYGMYLLLVYSIDRVQTRLSRKSSMSTSLSSVALSRRPARTSPKQRIKYRAEAPRTNYGQTSMRETRRLKLAMLCQYTPRATRRNQAGE